MYCNKLFCVATLMRSLLMPLMRWYLQTIPLTLYFTAQILDTILHKLDKKFFLHFMHLRTGKSFRLHVFVCNVFYFWHFLDNRRTKNQCNCNVMWPFLRIGALNWFPEYIKNSSKIWDGSLNCMSLNGCWQKLSINTSNVEEFCSKLMFLNLVP